MYVRTWIITSDHRVPEPKLYSFAGWKTVYIHPHVLPKNVMSNSLMWIFLEYTACVDVAHSLRYEPQFGPIIREYYILCGTYNQN